MSSNDEITIVSPSGIGDSWWALNKVLANNSEAIQGRKIILKPTMRKNYSSWFLSKLKGIESVDQHPMQFHELQFKSIMNYPIYESRGFEKENEIFLFPNTPLEMGIRIENYFPKIETKFDLDWDLDEDFCKETRQTYIKSNMKNVVLYTSSCGMNFKEETTEKWIHLTGKLYEGIENLNLILIGSYADKDLADMIEQTFPQITVVLNQPPEVVLTLLRSCDCFISFQSGMSVISVSYQVPTMMFYFSKYDKLRYSWCPPDSINNIDLYNPVFFDLLKTKSGINEIINWTTSHF